jgi:precorrin-6B methylase 2
MIKKIFYPDCECDIDESIPRYTPTKDIKAVIWLSRKCDGNILEIGCNSGITTNELCKFNPDKKIYALDYLQASQTISEEQKKEVPDKIGSLINKNCNVEIINKNSREFDFNDLKDVGFIFIDGDHSFESVKRDTEQSMNYIFKRGKGTICWHDYRKNPSWCGVKKLLDRLSARIPIKHFEGTLVAYTRVSKLF